MQTRFCDRRRILGSEDSRPLMPASRTLPEVPEVGGRIPPDTVHAVSVSLPRVQDVIGYEEKRSETMSRIKSGYPRFVAHPYVSELLAYFQSRLPASDAPCVVVSSPAAARGSFVCFQRFTRLGARCQSCFGRELQSVGRAALEHRREGRAVGISCDFQLSRACRYSPSHHGCGYW